MYGWVSGVRDGEHRIFCVQGLHTPSLRHYRFPDCTGLEALGGILIAWQFNLLCEHGDYRPQKGHPGRYSFERHRDNTTVTAALDLRLDIRVYRPLGRIVNCFPRGITKAPSSPAG